MNNARNSKEMTTAMKLDLVSRLVDYCNDVCLDRYTIQTRPLGSIEIHTDASLSGVFIKDLAQLCAAFGWSFGIYADDNCRPYVHICA